MNRLTRIGAAIAIIAGCGWAQAEKLPAWVTGLPSSAGHVYAVGSANIKEEGSEAKAISSAGEAAKVELLSTLRANVKSSQQSKATLKLQRSVKTESTLEEQVEKSTVITTSARDLPGLKIAETHIDRDSDSVYALAALDLSAATAELGRRQQQLESRLADLRAKQDPSLEDLGDAEAFLKKNGPTLDMAALLVSRLGKQAGKIQSAHDEYRALVTSLKKGITFGLEQQAATGRDVGALMSAVTAAGYSWSRQPRYTFSIETGVKPRADFAYGRNVIKGTINLMLFDGSGTVLKTEKLAGSGTGTSEVKAQEALDRRFDEQISDTIRNWLGGQAAQDPLEVAQADGEATEPADEDRGLTPGSDDRPVNWGRR